MRDETKPSGAPPPATLDDLLHALPAEPVPDDLLGRCLATTRGSRRPSPAVWALRAAAAVLVVVGSALLFVRTRPVDAAEMLKSVSVAWTKVEVSHQVFRIISPDGVRTEEAWFVRGKGRRRETRSGEELVGVVVNNGRWEFRWDLRGKLVAAWSTDVVAARRPPQEAGLVLDRAGFLSWAESHRAEIRIENDTIAGRPARKVVLRWPGSTDPGSAGLTETVWFDPESLRPLRQRGESVDGRVFETTIDYPAPDTVQDDLFRFSVPRDVVLEINDPDLGRQVYSEGVSREEE